MTPLLYLAGPRGRERNQTPQRLLISWPTSSRCPTAPQHWVGSTEFRQAVCLVGWDGSEALFHKGKLRHWRAEVCSCFPALWDRGGEAVAMSWEIPELLPTRGDALPASGDAPALVNAHV